MHLSIVIPTYQRNQSLFKLLNSIELQKFEWETLDIEVIVVSNKKNRTLHKSLTKSKFYQFSVKYIESQKVGVNIARNLGIDASVADIVQFIDDDCILEDSYYLEKVYKLHVEHPQLTGLGGRYTLPKSANAASLAYHINCEIWMDEQIHFQSIFPPLVGGNLSFKRAKLNSRTQFKEEIIFGGTETELIKRLVRTGHQLKFFDELVVCHNSRCNFLKLLSKAYRQGLGAKHETLANNLYSSGLRKQFLATKISDYVDDKKKSIHFYLNVYARLYSLGVFRTTHCIDSSALIAFTKGLIMKRLVWWSLLFIIRDYYYWLKFDLFQTPFIFPATKLFYFLQYQVSKIELFRSKIGKYSKSDFTK